MSEIFFQSSLPRSGSTLLQNIFAQNEDFYVTPTSGVIDLLYGARTNFSLGEEFKAQDSKVMESGFKGFCKSGLHGFFNSITDKPYVLDKGRGWLAYIDFLKFFHDKPKIICMVRDPRAIFSSMEKNFRKSQALGVFEIKDDASMLGTTTAKRVDLWASHPPIGLAMERLLQVIIEGKADKVCFVRYEDLMNYPQEEMDRIYNYLGVAPFVHNFNEIAQSTHEDDSVYATGSDHKIRPVLKGNPDDYDQILGSDLSDRIKNNYPWFYEYFGYALNE